MHNDFRDQLVSLILISSIDALLHNAATMFMARDFSAISYHFLKNKIIERTWKSIQ